MKTALFYLAFIAILFFLYSQVQIKPLSTQNGLYPNPKLTPGKLMAGVTKDQTCQAGGYTGKVRNVSSSTKDLVFSEYGIKEHKLGEYEVDHFIPLTLGGSNDIQNLWPQPAPQFHMKDHVELYLHDQVCNGKITLEEGQKEIRQWDKVYGTLKENLGDFNDPEGVE